ILRQRLPRSAQWRRRTALDRSLEPPPTGYDFRRHRPARTRGQRISPGPADERQHLRCSRTGPQVFAKGLRTPEGEERAVAGEGSVEAVGPTLEAGVHASLTRKPIVLLLEKTRNSGYWPAVAEPCACVRHAPEPRSEL